MADGAAVRGARAGARRREMIHVKFLVSVIDRATGSATPDEMVAIEAFNAALELEGQLVLAGGLADPGESLVVDGRGAETVVTEGPLHTAREYVSGFWVLEISDPELVRPIAAEASRACNRRVEVRSFL